MWRSNTYNQALDAENVRLRLAPKAHVEARLTNVSGAASATFVYDGDGDRVKATLGSVTTAYVGNYFEWTYSTTTMKKYYCAGGARVAMRESGTLYYLLSDHLGSTAITTNSSGSEVGELRYYPYGGTRYTSGTTPTSYRFTGQREDDTIGLYFYNARFYDPALGRFVQADTIVPSPGDPQDLNRYSYVRNSPLNSVDPSGHCSYNILTGQLECSGVNTLTVDGNVSGSQIFVPDGPFCRSEEIAQVNEGPDKVALGIELVFLTISTLGLVQAPYNVPPANLNIRGGSAGNMTPGQAVLGYEIESLPRTIKDVHNIGVTYGQAQAFADELTPVDWVNPFGHIGGYGQGFDDIMRAPNGDLVIVEYKGGSAKLSSGQMSQEWVENNIFRLMNEGDDMGFMLWDALQAGELSGIVYSTGYVPGADPFVYVEPTVMKYQFSYGGE